MRKVLAAAGPLALAVIMTGCSSTSAASVIDHPAGSSAVAHVGDTLDLETAAGRPFQLTLTQVVDPAQGTNGAATNNRRFIAVMFHFSNTSDHSLIGDSNSDANVVGSNGAVYSAVHQAVTECGSNSTTYKVSPGQTATNCVAFEVKTSVSITRVLFYPAAGQAADYGQWQVP